MIEFLIILLAGLGAGIATGLVGASAVVIAAPILIAFLGYTPYQAIGISLATDVLASLVAANNYNSRRNLDLKKALIIAVFAMIGAFTASVLSVDIPSTFLAIITGLVISITGITFITAPVSKRTKQFNKYVNVSFLKKHKTFSLVLFGLLIGIICGLFGAGGGVTILLFLLFIFDMQIHKAIGTSVLIMAFTALSGAIGHFLHAFPWQAVIIGSVGGAIGAYFASRYSNMAADKKLGKILGVVFFIMGLILIIKQLTIFF